MYKRQNQTHLGNFDGTSLVNLSQKDDIIEAQTTNKWVVIAHDQAEEWKNILVKVDKQDIHVMNKRALDRMLPGLLEKFND